MPSVRNILAVPSFAVAFGLFFALLAIFHLPTFAQGRAWRSRCGEVLPGRQRRARDHAMLASTSDRTLIPMSHAGSSHGNANEGDERRLSERRAAIL
jgi:hypothetical protein